MPCFPHPAGPPTSLLAKRGASHGSDAATAADMEAITALAQGTLERERGRVKRGN